MSLARRLRDELGKPGPAKHQLWKGGMKRFAAEAGAGAKRARTASAGHVDHEGRQFDLNQIIVNFANVGSYYGTKILGREKPLGGGAEWLGFVDWEGVRRCCRALRK